MPTKCRYAEVYKAKQPPRCSVGPARIPCDMCREKWHDAQQFLQAMANIAESVDHMNVKGQRKEMAKAVLRIAIQYATLKRAGFELEPLPNGKVSQRSI